MSTTPDPALQGNLVVGIESWTPGLALNVSVPPDAVENFVEALTSESGYWYPDFRSGALKVRFAAEKDWDSPQLTATAYLSIATSGYFFACTITRLQCRDVAAALASDAEVVCPVMMTVLGDDGLIERQVIEPAGAASDDGSLPLLVPVHLRVG